MKWIAAAIVLAALLLSAAMMASGRSGRAPAERYTTITSGGYVYRLDRQTGEMMACIAGACDPALPAGPYVNPFAEVLTPQRMEGGEPRYDLTRTLLKMASGALGGGLIVLLWAAAKWLWPRLPRLYEITGDPDPDPPPPKA